MANNNNIMATTMDYMCACNRTYTLTNVEPMFQLFQNIPVPKSNTKQHVAERMQRIQQVRWCQWGFRVGNMWEETKEIQKNINIYKRIQMHIYIIYRMVGPMNDRMVDLQPGNWMNMLQMQQCSQRHMQQASDNFVRVPLVWPRQQCATAADAAAAVASDTAWHMEQGLVLACDRLLRTVVVYPSKGWKVVFHTLLHRTKRSGLSCFEFECFNNNCRRSYSSSLSLSLIHIHASKQKYFNSRSNIVHNSAHLLFFIKNRKDKNSWIKIKKNCVVFFVFKVPSSAVCAVFSR